MRYENPLWQDYFADPFVLRSGEAYYAYGTGAEAIEPDRRAFRILKSLDLVSWQYVGGAVEPISGATAFWAPEVVESHGHYFLFYSAAIGAGDEFHRLRVAVSDHPEGPFIDSGQSLLSQDIFAIDAHPFCDPKTNLWYVFFATDCVADEPYGTALAVVRLKNMLSAEGELNIILRASRDWQVYERNRNYQSRLWPAWYTLEGPCVVYHDQRYWCLYSGGRWSTAEYGVGFAVAEHPMGPWRDGSAAEGPVVLRGIPGQILGPGHNSVILAPDGRSTMMVYHAWGPDMKMRRMCMDPLIWVSGGPRCDGPSTGPRVFGGVALDALVRNGG